MPNEHEENFSLSDVEYLLFTKRLNIIFFLTYNPLRCLINIYLKNENV